MATKATKKVSTVKKPTAAHPPYAEMIKEAIAALKERTGSSQIAIAKFIDDKHSKTLPQNYKKLLLSQLKRLVASGSLTKVKSSFKLAPKTDTKPVKTAPKKVTAKKVTAKKVTAGAGAGATPVKSKKVTVKGKKATPKKVAKKGTPAVKKAKAVKSIKSPVKKAKKASVVAKKVAKK